MSTRTNYESDDAYRLRKLLEYNQVLLQIREIEKQEAEEVSRRIVQKVQEKES